MVERFLDGRHFVRRTYQLLTVGGLGFVVILPFLYAKGRFCLGNVKVRDLETVLLFNVCLQFGISGFAFGHYYIFRFQVAKSNVFFCV